MVAFDRVIARVITCAALLSCCLLIAACATIAGGPQRLYSVDQEVAEAQAELPTLQSAYYNPPSGTDPTTYYGSDLQKMYRNEYIGRRMYVIDVEYSQYEAALTSDRQKFMFGSAVTGEVLNTVGSLSVPGITARALNASAGAVNATGGFYDSDLVIAKTIQIVEAQMRAQRDTVAQTILQRMNEPTGTYPLALALSDLEDYYRAGTMNTGLIEAAGDASQSATKAAAAKAIVVTYGSNASTTALAACLNSPGVTADKLVALLPTHSHALLGQLLFDTSTTAEGQRVALLSSAKAAGLCP